MFPKPLPPQLGMLLKLVKSGEQPEIQTFTSAVSGMEGILPSKIFDTYHATFWSGGTIFVNPALQVEQGHVHCLSQVALHCAAYHADWKIVTPNAA